MGNNPKYTDVWSLMRIEPQGPGGDSNIKVTGMLVVSLWGVNCRFWSNLGCLGWKVSIFAHSGITYNYA